ncbi:MAG: hypothetical protein JXL81_12955 [Deltaproteobacteria bacterium]|nr:hypothetical protein [Deltaproteobacteria bacterium]
MGIPATAIVLAEFYEQEKQKALQEGMPGVRTQWIQGPVWAKTAEQLRKDVIEGVNPLSGRPVMKEIVENFTKPLTDEEKKTGEIKRDRGPETYTGTREELHKLFLEKRFTDFMPIVLPTKERVEEMLMGTSHDPDEVVGKMSPTNTGDYFEFWTFTVRDVAVNAVMAGCKPEYMPVLLAILSPDPRTGISKEAISISDNGFMGAVVINGNIRDEIGLNYDVGAVGPFAHANTTIGRAWSLASINLGNGGKVGTTYMGVIGNHGNAINMVIAENEEKSPFKPFSVRLGFEKGENVVSLFEGWGILSAANWAANRWGGDMDYPQIMKDITAQQGFLFGTIFVLSPPIANFVKQKYNTIEELEKAISPAPAFGFGGPPKATPGAKSDSSAPKPAPKMMPMGPSIPVIVTGASNNNYWSAGGMRYSRSIKIDDWR